MKPPLFTYHDPATLEEAVALMASLDNARPLAGGQSLMPMLNMRFVQPDHVIDLNRIADLAGIRLEGAEMVIGAMTRQRDLEFSPLIADRLPLMAEALTHVGHRQTRNRGTIGGSLCHLDPAAELVAVCAAQDAVVEVAGPEGRRHLPFAEFPLGFMMPAMEFNELLVAVRVPLWPLGHGAAFVEFARRHGDFAIVSAAALMTLDGGGAIARVALALGGVGTGPLRMEAIEAGLVGTVPGPDTFRAAAEAAREIEAMEDALVTSSYRRSLAAVMARRALETAFARAESNKVRQ